MPSSSPAPFSSRIPQPSPLRVLTGWGRTSPSAARVIRAHCQADLQAAFDDPPARGVIARGLGRSYGDPAQNAGGRVVDTTGTCEFELDPATGIVRASAGASLDDLMRAIVPRGFFVPVTPGTRYVTVGGAIAADIHGKNHHKAGSWSQHVLSFRLATPDGSVLDVEPEENPELFWATAGGMGLTGMILDATFRCPAIESSRLVVDTERAPDLDTVLTMMDERDHLYDYSVAWIDLAAKGRATGRSILQRGHFATLDELNGPALRDPYAYRAEILADAPPVFPSGLLNNLSVKAFNELWFRKSPKLRFGELQTIPQFFHPLDMVGSWNNIYGPHGFFQWQFVVPFDYEDVLRTIIDRLSSAGCTSFLAVLKRFGPGSAGHLSFPAPGWALALDIPAGNHRIAVLLDELDERVVDAGGRLYLAKDSRMSPKHLPLMYPRIGEWRDIRRKVDPDGVLRSDLSRRLGLT